MELKITCTGEGLINYKDIIPFQGNLKRRGTREITKLTNSIIKHGISFPFFIWKNNHRNMCIDGHGRLLAFVCLEKEGYIIPDVPFVEIIADNETEAKKKLLYANCHYGDLTYDLVMEFVGDSGIDLSNFLLPSGNMDYGGDIIFDPTSFKIEIPKITDTDTEIESITESNDLTPKFRIGKTTIELEIEEAERLKIALDDYGKRNNGLFGFITEFLGG
jgi:hypothetical protein